MLLISAILSFPSQLLKKAYNQTSLEFPLKNKDDKAIKFGDDEHSGLANELEGNKLREAIAPFLKEQNIRDDLIIREASCPKFCHAVGTNYFKRGAAVITMGDEFYNADNEAALWVVKHEISHIKNNDLFTLQMIPAICKTAAVIFGFCFLSPLSLITLSSVVSLLSQTLFTQWREAKADDFAIRNSTIDELKGGRRILKAMQSANLSSRKTFFQRLMTSSTGDSRIDIFHPSLSSRIRKIEKALNDKNIAFDKEDPKQKALNDFIQEEFEYQNKKIAESGGFLKTLKNSFLV